MDEETTNDEDMKQAMVLIAKRMETLGQWQQATNCAGGDGWNRKPCGQGHSKTRGGTKSMVPGDGGQTRAPDQEQLRGHRLRVCAGGQLLRSDEHREGEAESVRQNEGGAKQGDNDGAPHEGGDEGVFGEAT